MTMNTTAMPRFGAHTLAALTMAFCFTAIAPAMTIAIADAKTPGSTYCFYGTCHRVKTLAETQALVGKEHTLPASFYDDCKADRYNPCGLTSSGERFRPSAPDNAASPIYPDGTKLLVWSPETKRALVLRINNAGPYWGNRTLDVSRSAAETLGFKARGVANLKARILEAPTKAEATYKQYRTYEPVAGDIGQYESAREAEAAVTSLQQVAAATLAPFNGKSLPKDLVTDDLKPAAGVAVAANDIQPKLPREAVADASALATLQWPVVRDTAIGDTSQSQTKTAELGEAGLNEPARTETLSQRVTKAHLADADDDIKSERAETKSRSGLSRAASKKDSARPAAGKQVARAKPVAVASAVKAVPATPPVQRDAPNDMSVFSRHNPDAPKLTIKQAYNKPALLKTSALTINKARRES